MSAYWLISEKKYMLTYWLISEIYMHAYYIENVYKVKCIWISVIKLYFGNCEVPEYRCILCTYELELYIMKQVLNN